MEHLEHPEHEAKTVEKAEMESVAATPKAPTGRQPAWLYRPLTVKIAVGALILIALGCIAFYTKGWFVAAVVNGQPISRLTVIREVERTAGQQALDSLIRQQLIDSEAAKQGVVVGEDEISTEMAELEEQISDQGGTSLDEALAAQNLTREDIRKRIITQKKLEKLLGDRVNVTDEEVEQYITESGMELEAGKEEENKTNIREFLKNTKFSEEAGMLVDELMAKADIKYWAGY